MEILGYNHVYTNILLVILQCQSVNGGLCIPCVFHLKINHNQVGKCVTSPLIKFKGAIAEI